MRYLVLGELLLVVVGLLQPVGEGGQPGIPLLHLAGQLADTRLQAVQLGPAHRFCTVQNKWTNPLGRNAKRISPVMRIRIRNPVFFTPGSGMEKNPPG